MPPRRGTRLTAALTVRDSSTPAFLSGRNLDVTATHAQFAALILTGVEVAIGALGRSDSALGADLLRRLGRSHLIGDFLTDPTGSAQGV